VRVVQATPAEVAACVEALGRAGNGGERWAGERLVGLYFVVAREPAEGLEAHRGFCSARWESVEGDFRGRHGVLLSDTLGARYLDYLLHRANVPISAFHLEVESSRRRARRGPPLQFRRDRWASEARL